MHEQIQLPAVAYDGGGAELRHNQGNRDEHTTNSDVLHPHAENTIICSTALQGYIFA